MTEAEQLERVTKAYISRVVRDPNNSVAIVAVHDGHAAISLASSIANTKDAINALNDAFYDVFGNDEKTELFKNIILSALVDACYDDKELYDEVQAALDNVAEYHITNNDDTHDN